MRKISFEQISLFLIGFLTPAYLVRFNLGPLPTTLLEVAIWLIFIIAAVRELASGRRLVKFNWQIARPLGLLILGGLVGLAVTPQLRVGLGQFKAWLIDPLLATGVIYWSVRRVNWKRTERAAVGGLLLAGLMVALWAISQKLTGQTTSDGRVLGIFNFDSTASPNFLSLFLAPLLPLAVALVGQVKSSGRKIAASALALIILLAVYFSGSRGGLLAGLVAVGYLISLKFLPNWRRIVWGILALAIVGVLWLARPDLTAAPTAGRVASSNNVRFEIYKATGQMLVQPKNFIFGVGLGNYQNYFVQFTNQITNYPRNVQKEALTPHNLYLAIWINFGLAGLVGFVWLVWLVWRKNQSRTLQAALLAILIYGLIDTPLLKNDLAVIFAVIITLMLASSASKQEPR